MSAYFIYHTRTLLYIDKSFHFSSSAFALLWIVLVSITIHYLWISYWVIHSFTRRISIACRQKLDDWVKGFLRMNGVSFQTFLNLPNTFFIELSLLAFSIFFTCRLIHTIIQSKRICSDSDMFSHHSTSHVFMIFIWKILIGSVIDVCDTSIAQFSFSSQNFQNFWSTSSFFHSQKKQRTDLYNLLFVKW